LSDQSTRILELVELAGVRLYRLLLRLTLRDDTADELLQELVLRLSRSNGFQRADDTYAYARRAAIHLAFDWRRRQGNARQRIEPLSGEPAVAAPDLLGKLVDREELERVLVALERVSPLGRTCLVLHYMEQLSYTEVAEQLDMTPHQVRAACSKAIRRLQRILGVQPSGLPKKEAPDEIR
jgi:RNA polymerase sigma factor (sigma-70 family)